MTSNFLDWYDQAQRYLWSRGVLTVDQLADAHAYWQPQGFVVFELGTLELGVERVHVWARDGLRRPDDYNLERSTWASFHDHVGHVASRVRHGVYRDELATLAWSDDGDGVTYEVQYSPVEKLVRLDGHVSVTSIAERIVSTKHGLRFDQYHRTQIPEDELVVTHVVRGVGYQPHPHVIYPRQITDVELLSSREELTVKERVQVIAQLVESRSIACDSVVG